MRKLAVAPVINSGADNKEGGERERQGAGERERRKKSAYCT